MSVIGLQGYITPAVGDENLVPVKVHIDNLIAESGKPKATPDYDKEVLQPLHDAQAAEQAKEAAEQQTLEQEQLSQAAQVQVQTGTCADWLAAAGVTDIADAMWIINRESGCNPWAVNPSGGACGVAQELPCGKSGCVIGDGACQVMWMNGYVNARYGGWSSARAFWQAHSWY